MTCRYSRQTVLNEIGISGQKKLLNSRVAIIGCGALGTVIANNLVRAGIGSILIIDRDLVELSNLQRQTLFDETDIGKPKVFAAQEKLEKINSEINIEIMLKDLNSNNIEQILTGFDLIMDATDNIPTRLLINDFCVKNRIPWIYAGVIETRGMIKAILPDLACFRCMIPEEPPAGTFPSCDTVGVLNTIPNIIGSIESTEAFKILLGKDVEKDLILYDGWNNKFEKIKFDQNISCECCKNSNYKFLNKKNTEIITELCEKGVQIIPERNRTFDLKKIAGNIKEVVSDLNYDEYVLSFKIDGKKMVLFSDGRAIIKGIGDKGAAKSFYTRYIGL